MEFIYDFLFPILWVAWLIYWYVLALRSKRTVRRASLGWRVAYGLPLVAGATLFTLNGDHDSFLWQQIYPQSHATFWIGVAVMLSGIAFTVWARVTLGSNWSSVVTVKANHELVQTGPYALVRHPIYTGILVMFMGNALEVAQWRSLLSVVLVLISFLIKLRLEERWMVELFGPTYEAYRKRVAMLVPWVW
jgi:protein-S-isoprenylcysteine O-methyltransferase Ste14